MSIRMRHTRGHTKNRRSHHALSALAVVKDSETGNLRLPHRLDETTGMYRGKQIAPARALRTPKGKKGPSTSPEAPHKHEHAHEEHMSAETKVSQGVTGKVTTGGRPKARSGFGGGA